MKNTNLCQLCLLPDAISEMFAQAMQSGKITLADRYGLMAAFLESALTEDEQNSVNRLLYCVRKGRVQIVD